MREMKMKMAAISTVAALLLCSSIVAATDSQTDCDLHAAKDSNSEVPLRHTLNSMDRLVWRFSNNVIFSRRENQQMITGMKDDVSENGSLRLLKVDKSKAGIYTAEVHKDGKLIYTKSMNLCVMDSVKKPTVKMDCLSSSVKFTCILEQAKDVKFEWLQNNKVLEKEISQILKPKYTKERWEEMQTDTFSCRVSNQVSNESSAPVQQTCIKPKPDFPQEVLGINIWILVGSGGGVVLLLIIIIIVCCCRNRRKKRMQVKDEEELRLGWTNPNQQNHHHYHQHNHPPDQHPHQHHHHHHHQQQPAGHTGPRQHRPKQQRNQQRPRAPDVPNGHPQPSPRRPAQGPRPVDNVGDEQPPPLPQPRKKAPKTPRE